MIGTQRRHAPTAIDFDEFDDSEVDNATKILKMFAMKNKRVIKIFQEDPEQISAGGEQQQNQDQSYGVRFVSQRNSNAGKENASNEESSSQNSQRSSRRLSQHIRTLSPIDIVVSSSNEINEPLSRNNGKQPAPGPQAPGKNSLRRSLFEKNKNENSDSLVSSTPMALGKNGRKSSTFFNSQTFSAKDSLSPIKNSEGETISKIASKSDAQSRPKQANIGEIEDDLRAQFNIDKTPTRASKARTSATPSKNKQTQNEAENRRVIVEPVAENPTVQTRPRLQLSRCSVGTDNNTVGMVETPIIPNRLSEQIDLENLKQILNRCEETDDEESSMDLEVQNQTSPKKTPTRRNRSRKLTNVINTNKTYSQLSGIDAEDDTGRKTGGNLFAVPQAVPALNNSERDSSINRVIPVEVMESFRNLARRNTTQMESMTSIVTIEKSGPPQKVYPAKTDYLAITKQRAVNKRKQKRSNSRKRTLYNDEEDEDIELQASNSSGENSQQRSENEIVQNTIITSSVQPKPTQVAVSPEKGKRRRIQEVSSMDKSDGRSDKSTESMKNTSVNAATRMRSAVKSKTAKYRRIQLLKNSSSEKDEGFDSEQDKNSDDDDLRYIPNKDRYALRDRRYAKPYWIRNEKACNFRYFIPTTFKQQKEIANLKNKLKSQIEKGDFKRYHEYQVLNDPTGILNYGTRKVNPLSKMMKNLKHKQKNITKPASKLNSVTTKCNVNEAENYPKADENLQKFSRLMKYCDIDKEGSVASATSVISRPNLDAINLEHVEFFDCGDGLHFGRFFDHGLDGCVKIKPGGFKKKTRSKTTDVKFFVLSGKMDVVVDDERFQIDTYGFINVKHGTFYEFKNTTESDAIVLFIRHKIENDENEKS